MSDIIERHIEQVLEQIRPTLRMDAGDIELIEFEEDTGTVHVRLLGACAGCPMSQITLKMGIQAALQDAIPQVKHVLAVE